MSHEFMLMPTMGSWHFKVEPREIIELPEDHPLLEVNASGRWWSDHEQHSYVLAREQVARRNIEPMTQYFIGTQDGSLSDLIAFREFILAMSKTNEPQPRNLTLILAAVQTLVKELADAQTYGESAIVVGQLTKLRNNALLELYRVIEARLKLPVEDTHGLYPKYWIVNKQSRQEVTGAFVLKPETDPYARVAMRIYAQAVYTASPQLALDLIAWIDALDGVSHE